MRAVSSSSWWSSPSKITSSLQAELAREPSKPDVALFACLSPQSQGGAITVCDGVELVRASPADVRAGLSGRRLLDNSRFLHGRTAILDAQERLIASYFGYLGFAPINPEEPANPRWRRADFRSPSPPGWEG